MPQDDYERYRKRLETQFHADIGMLYDAFHAKLRAYQTMVRSRSGDLDLDLAPQPPAGPSVPAPAPAAPVPPESPSEIWTQPTVAAMEEILPRLPEEFDKQDVIRALGYAPRRSTLYGALQELRWKKLIEVVRERSGKRGSRYRKVAAASRTDPS